MSATAIDTKALPPVYFLRHGETPWNRERRIQGQTDIELSDKGRSQAARMAARLRELIPDPSGFTLQASPLKRSRQTMQAVLETYRLQSDAVVYDIRLIELNFGVMEGKGWPDIHALGIEPEVRPEEYHDWRPEGGESYADARNRAIAWLQELSKPVIVVAHGGISRIIRGIVLDLPKREIVTLKVPQDRIFCLQNGGIDWFDARD